jgi:hypothetical protein
VIGLLLQGKAGRPPWAAGFLWLPLLVLAGCSWRQTATVPAQIVGEWRTQEPRYQGRFIRLENRQITFGLGGLAPAYAERIEKVGMVPPQNPTDYVLGLREADGTSDSITLHFSPENGGELRIKNQPGMVWRHPLKSEPSKTLPSGARVEHKTIYKIDCLLPEHCHSY